MASKYTDVAALENQKEEALYIRGATDFQFFAGLCIPQVMRFPFPPLYVAIWTLLVTAISKEDREAILRFAIGLPRGFAKTTFLKILVCWLIVYDKVSFVLIVGATEPLSQNFLADVNNILASPNLESIYGKWTANLAIDNREEKKCSYRRRIVIIKASGAGTAVRGINIAYERPDLILCDDAQTKENADSDAESAHLLDWFVGTLFNVVDPVFSMIIYSGNMYPQNCVLQKFQEHADWISLVTGCILADGKSLWEEVHPIKKLWKHFKHDEALGRGHIWFSEYMNQPILDKVSLLPTAIPVKPPIDGEVIPDGGFVIIDPAGLKKTSDDNVLTFCYTIDRYVAVTKMVIGTSDPEEPVKTPKEVIKSAIKHCLRLGIRLVCIENAGYQATLQFWFQEIVKEEGLQGHFAFCLVSPKGMQKEARIVKSTRALYDGSWFFTDEEARQRYIFQALQYKVGKPKQKDDILDCCSYIEEMRTPENWKLIQQYPMNAPEMESGKLLGQNLPF